MALLIGGGNVFRVEIPIATPITHVQQQTKTTNDNPPLYEEIPAYDEPPIYDTISTISACSSLAVSSASTLTKFTEVFCNTAAAAAVSCFTALLPLFAVVLGSTTLESCPAQPKIPQFLIVGGALGLVKFLVHFTSLLVFKYKHAIKKSDHKSKTNRIQIAFHCVDGILTLLVILLAVSGVFLVFGLNPTFIDVNDAKYCDKLTYHFAFALLAVFFLASLFAILTGFISVLVLCANEKK